jgi:hypothetical protein
MVLAACLSGTSIDHITTNARRSSLQLRMANYRRMLDKMVPKSTMAISCEVTEKDKERFYSFIKNNRIPIAIRVDFAGVCEAVVIENVITNEYGRTNDCRNYTKENTSGYYVLMVGNYREVARWLETTLEWYYHWSIGEKMTYGYQLEV